jgi:hypothetical protein
VLDALLWMIVYLFPLPYYNSFMSIVMMYIFPMRLIVHKPVLETCFIDIFNPDSMPNGFSLIPTTIFLKTLILIEDLAIVLITQPVTEVTLGD